ncbi:MAG: HAD-IIIA family hydrolase [Propionibacteriaceae bacterium]|jgi:HAD superfamily hydrolase (TIGR01662 family)
MTHLRYAVVIPTIGRQRLADLITAVDGDPAPSCIVVADDRRDATSALDLPATATPLVVVRTHGRGPAAARNAGWRAADADWIAFLDDDVAIPADWCQRLVKDLEDLPDKIAASQAGIYVPSPDGRRPTDAERRTLGLSGASWITADMAYRRAALVETGGFDERFPRAFREDADLALRTARIGYGIAWGERVTTHPLAPSSSWRNSLKDQAGNADNALMRAKYGHRWRSLIGTTPGRTGRHLLTTTAAATALIGYALSLSKRLRVRPSTSSGRVETGIVAAAGIIWAALTTEFAAGRIVAGPRTTREISTMLVTSVVIPPLAVAHRLRGEIRVRLAGWSDNDVFANKPRAVLFDRDGTLIKDVPYLADPGRVQPMPGARRILNQLRRQGVAVGVVSNQSGVARGLINPDELARVNDRVESLLGPFDTWQVCTHAPDAGCSCRKPSPGLVMAAAAELGLAPHECLMIGDIGSDVDAALAAGARAVLVPTRHTKIGEIDHAQLVAAVAPNLRTAVRRHVGRSQ